MKEKDYMFSAAQCRTKLTTLKRQYKKVIDHNKATGSNRKDWPYLHVSLLNITLCTFLLTFKILQIMNELFEGKPWVEPVSTASSTDAKVPLLEHNDGAPMSRCDNKTNIKRLAAKGGPKFFATICFAL